MTKAPTTPAGASFETGMLAYARSVQITEGLFFATSSTSNARTPIEVLEKGVRGQSSAYKTDNPGKSNLQSIEYAVIPQDHDGVELSFSIRFMPFSLKPHACGDSDVGDAYMRLAEGYRKADGYSILAELYAWNIANGRFAWRNRFQSDAMTVTVNFDEIEIVIDPFKVSLEKPGTRADLKAAMVKGNAEDFDTFIGKIAHGLSNADKKASTVNIRWNAKMLPGQEIFPSQEYVREAKKEPKKENQLSRVYAKLPKMVDGKTIGQASMHSQKIGAALRHIDIWHDNDSHHAAIAVNPYSGVQETGQVLRDKSSKKDFYALRRNAVPFLENVERASTVEDISDEVHFIMANLVRGGVFGSKNTEKTNKEETNA